MDVLVVDNCEETLQFLGDILGKEGFNPIRAISGESALDKYREKKPDFICLDINMEGLSGHDICRTIRKKDEMTPIVFITAKSKTIDKVVGLELGADDYIVKPFDINEVVARVRAVARRSLAISNADDLDAFFQMQDVSVFPNKLKAWKNDLSIDLSLREVRLLKLLHEQKGAVVDRNLLLDYCWGIDTMPDSRVVDWHIGQIRKKIETDQENPSIIQTVHGEGYKFG